MTPQRQLVLDAVDALGHATPDEVLTPGPVARPTASTSPPSTARSSCSRSSAWSAHTHLGHGSPTYHAADARAATCTWSATRCGAVTEAELGLADGLVGSLEAAHGFDH